MAQLDFPNSPTNGQQYSAPNGAIYTYDGTAWTVSGVLSTGSAAGGDLSGTYPNPSVVKSAGAFTVGASPLTLTGSTLVAGTRTAKGRVIALPEYDIAAVTLNASWSGAWAQDDASIASWRLSLSTANNWLTVERVAPGGTATAVLQSLGTGDFQISGSTATKATGTTWANPSDPRLKDDVEPYTRGLAEILKLEPIRYTLNGLGGTPAGVEACGFDAEAVRAIFPECVTVRKGKLHPDDEEETDILSLDIHGILIALVNAVQELAARNPDA